MEDEVFGADSGGSGGNMNSGKLVTLFLVLTALFLGATGIYMAHATRKEFLEFRKEVRSKPDASSGIRDDLAELDARLIKVGGETVKNRDQARSIVAQTQHAFDTVTKEVGANRERLSAANEMLKKLGAGTGGARSGAAVSPRAADSGTGEKTVGPSGTPAPETSGGHHTIASGDTFDKLARVYGKTVDEFLQANPGVNPLRLQIGQRIRIPE